MFNLNSKIVLILLLSLSVITFASNSNTDDKYEIIEKNLLIGLNSDNIGLKISSAYFLGEIKSDKAVFPLMKILKNSTSEEERLIAALSLSKIQSATGMFAVKQRIKFDDSERVQRLCKIFYNNYKLNEIDSDVIVEPFQIADLNLEYKGIKLQQFLNWSKKF